MVFNLVLCMRASSIILHQQILIQLLAESYPPERRGFKPLKTDELNKARGDLSALIEANKADKDRLTRVMSHAN